MFVQRVSTGLAAVFAASVLAWPSSAAPILLKNDRNPNVCEVEVTVGPEAPSGPVQRFADLEGMWEQAFDTDKLCYRFSSPPETCGAWTDWRCCEASGSGESLCVIE